MKAEDFKALFPLKATITQEMINKANIYNRKECIGALALKSVLLESIKRPKIDWANSIGYVRLNGNEYGITTHEKLMMMYVSEPQEITFDLTGNVYKHNK